MSKRGLSLTIRESIQKENLNILPESVSPVILCFIVSIVFRWELKILPFFENTLNIDNLITRIRGGQIDRIDGLIRANDTANRFVLNPSGIVFAENARLDIGGWFFGSTAQQRACTLECTLGDPLPCLSIAQSGCRTRTHSGQWMVQGEEIAECNG